MNAEGGGPPFHRLEYNGLSSACESGQGAGVDSGGGHGAILTPRRNKADG